MSVIKQLLKMMPGYMGGKAGRAETGKGRNRFSANVFSLFKIMY